MNVFYLHGISIIFLLIFYLNSRLKFSKLLIKIQIILQLLLLVFIFSLRDYNNSAFDLPVYMEYFNDTKRIIDVFISSSSWKADYIYFLIIPLLHAFNFDQFEYITFQTFLNIALLFYSIYRIFNNDFQLIFLTFFLIVCTSSFYFLNGNVLRQGLAVPIIILSTTFVPFKSRTLLRSSTFFIHKGALFSIFDNLDFGSKKMYYLIFLLSAIIGVSKIHLFLLQMLPLPNFISQKLEFYSTFERASSNSMIKLVLLFLFNFVFIYFHFNAKIARRLFTIFFVFSNIALIFITFDGIYSRTILYTDTIIPILLVFLLKERFSLRKQYIYLLIFISLFYSVYVYNHPSILGIFGI